MCGSVSGDSRGVVLVGSVVSAEHGMCLVFVAEFCSMHRSSEIPKTTPGASPVALRSS